VYNLLWQGNDDIFLLKTAQNSQAQFICNNNSLHDISGKTAGSGSNLLFSVNIPVKFDLIDGQSNHRILIAPVEGHFNPLFLNTRLVRLITINLA
jgi:hypothetical protein